MDRPLDLGERDPLAARARPFHEHGVGPARAGTLAAVPIAAALGTAELLVVAPRHKRGVAEPAKVPIGAYGASWRFHDARRIKDRMAGRFQASGSILRLCLCLVQAQRHKVHVAAP